MDCLSVNNEEQSGPPRKGAIVTVDRSKVLCTFHRQRLRRDLLDRHIVLLALRCSDPMSKEEKEDLIK